MVDISPVSGQNEIKVQSLNGVFLAKYALHFKLEGYCGDPWHNLSDVFVHMLQVAIVLPSAAVVSWRKHLHNK